MRASAKLYYGKSKTPGRRISIKGARSVSEAIRSLDILTAGTNASKAEITITEKARRKSAHTFLRK